MTATNWASFMDWAKIYKETNCGLESPFNDEPLTPNSLFLWNQASAPLPSGSTDGSWGIFPEPKALVGYLRYIALPIFFEIWLVREEWDDEHEKFIKAEDLFTLAENSGKCRYLDDIPLMKTLVAELDSSMDKDDETVKSSLHKIAKKFNDRWEDTPTWSFKIDIYTNPIEVGDELYKRLSDEMDEEDIDEALGMTKKEWMDICKRALVDKPAQELFSEKLKESGEY